MLATMIGGRYGFVDQDERLLKLPDFRGLYHVAANGRTGAIYLGARSAPEGIPPISGLELGLKVEVRPITWMVRAR